MKTALRILAVSVFILLVAALDVAFFPAAGHFIGQTNISLMVALFLVIILQPRLAMLFYLASSVLIGLSSSSEIILPVIIGLFVLFVIDKLFEQIFTNRSYYTLAGLGLLGWLLYYVLFSLAAFITSLFSSRIIAYVTTWLWWRDVLLNALFMLVLYSLLYVVVNFTSKRFRSYFITTPR